MPVDYFQPSWQQRQRTPGAGVERLLGIMQQKQQLAAQDQQMKARVSEAALNMQARKEFQDGVAKINEKYKPDDPMRSRALNELGMVTLGKLGKFSPQMFPKPTPLQSVLEQAQVPGTGTAQTPFKAELDSILKGGGIAPAPPSQKMATGVRNPNTGALTFPAALNPRPVRPAAVPRPPLPQNEPAGAIFIPATGTTPAHWQRPMKPVIPKPVAAPKPTALDDAKYRAMQKRQDDLSKLWDAAKDGTAKAALGAQMKENNEEMKAFSAKFSGGTAKAIPMPADKAALQKDTLYATPHGDATWDGDKFVQQ